MVWFTFTFLLGLPKGSTVEDKSKKKPDKLQVSKNYVELDVAKPNFACHIEYVLFPNEAPKRIDVACWDEVAKIYFENATSAIRPKVVQSLRWIHFRVNHNVKLTTSEVPVFHGHHVKVGLSLGNKKFGDQAKSDNTKKFYAPNFQNGGGEEEGIRQQFFQPVSETLEDLTSVSYPKDHLTPRQHLYVTLDTAIETSECSELLMRTISTLSDEYHDVNFVRVPSSPAAKLPPIRNILKPEPERETAVEPKKKEREKTVDKKKEAQSDGIEYSMAGEDFFSGQKVFETCVKYNSDELPYLFNVVRVRKVLTKSQARYFNPLSVTLRHCNNIPVESFNNRGVTLLKFRYLIFKEFLVESNAIPIKENIKLNFSRTFLTNETDRNQLVHFLQTGGLKIQVFGNLPREKFIPPTSVFQEEELDYRTRRWTQTRPRDLDGPDEFVLLATAFVDVSSLLLQPHRLLVKCNLQIPPHRDPIDHRQDLKDYITVYEFYSGQQEKVTRSEFPTPSSPPLPVLTVSVKFGSAVAKLYQSVMMNPNLSNRLFAVIYDRNIAISIKQIIQNDTRKLLEPVNYCRNGLNLKRPLTKNNLGTVCTSDSSNISQMTGFFIESKNKTLVFVEGSPFGAIQQVWMVLSFVKPTQGRVLYDSSLIFTERLYQSFLKYGGFFKVNLHNDGELIQMKPRRCSQFPVPDLSWKAMTSLNMLIHCRSIKAATQNNLFPDSDALNCLALEFGLPMQMCEKEN